VHCELGGHHNQKKKKINGIGLFCHEFSHTLGLPDLYAPSGNLSPNVAMEEWDLMDGGEYVGDGVRQSEVFFHIV
jgi:immune inhibitor A